jgi:hypothetical protein
MGSYVTVVTPGVQRTTVIIGAGGGTTWLRQNGDLLRLKLR